MTSSANGSGAHLGVVGLSPKQPGRWRARDQAFDTLLDSSTASSSHASSRRQRASRTVVAAARVRMREQQLCAAWLERADARTPPPSLASSRLTPPRPRPPSPHHTHRQTSSNHGEAQGHVGGGEAPRHPLHLPHHGAGVPCGAAVLAPLAPVLICTTHAWQKDVFNLKEIEGLAAKQGVVQQR